jgi:uncharacterized PurR-regulated membrane protein YhhQ (DUF165 family)
MFETVTSWQIGYIVFAGVAALILLRIALEIAVKLLEFTFRAAIVALGAGAVVGIYDRYYGPYAALEGIGTKWQAFTIAFVIMIACVMTIPSNEKTAKSEVAAKSPTPDIKPDTKSDAPPKTDIK